MAYSTKGINRRENPRNVGSFDRADASIGDCLANAFTFFVNKLNIKTF